MRITRRWFWATALVPLSLLITGGVVYAAHPTVRWDIVSLQPPDLLPGGIASARTNVQDNSKITLTGSGTFQLKPGNPQATGGGNWTTFDSTGSMSGSGTYEVTGVAHFGQAPGTLPPVNDHIGDPTEAKAGLVVLSIAYSDGSEGTLTVHCGLLGTPASLSASEGISATKGFVDYWRIEPPQNDPFVDANRTVFHISR